VIISAVYLLVRCLLGCLKVLPVLPVPKISSAQVGGAIGSAGAA
jgi:hypothetical protein